MQIYLGGLASGSCYYEGKILIMLNQKLLSVILLSPVQLIKIHFSVLKFQDFPSQIVHIAVNCVDQYLMRRKVQRSELQLLGITCMLIAARSVMCLENRGTGTWQ